jgi:hypothetical protein
MAARAATAAPNTGMPLACQAPRAAAKAWLLPVPALPTTTSTPTPDRVTWRTIATCSADSES